MKIELTIIERIRLLSILPKEGNFITLRLIKGLTEKIGFSPQEITDFEIKEENGMVHWNEKGNIPINIEFLDAENDLIKKELKALDSVNKLTMDLFTIYEKFIL